MKRRDFFKVITGFITGVCVLFVPKVKGNEKPKLTLAMLMKCKEELEKADGEYIELQRSEYLEGSEIKCLMCGGTIKLEKGYYRLGDYVKCQCGNGSRFVMRVKVAVNKG